MEDITIVLADKQPLTAVQVSQAHERILAEGAAAERERIRLELLAEADKVSRRCSALRDGQLYNEGYEAALREYADRLEPVTAAGLEGK